MQYFNKLNINSAKEQVGGMLVFNTTVNIEDNARLSMTFT